MPLPLRYSTSSLWRRRTTTLSAASGIALLVFVLAASLMLSEGLRRAHASSGELDRVLVIQQDSYSEAGSRLRQSVVNLVKAAPGIAKDETGQPLVTAETVVHVYSSHVDDENRLASVQVRGVAANALELRDQVRVIRGRAPKPGTQEAMVGRALEGVYQGLSLGESVALQKSRRVEIVGVFEAEGSSYESELWADEEVVKASFGYEGYVSSITAQLRDEEALAEFEAGVKQTVPTGLNIERERSYYERVSSGLADSISGLGLVIGFVFCLGAALGAAIAMFGAVAERVTEIGVLRALGFSARHVLFAFLLESLGLSLLGGVAGIALALLTPLLRFSTVNWATGQEVAFGFMPSAGILLASIGAGVLVGMLGGLFPAARAARIDTLTAMRE